MVRGWRGNTEDRVEVEINYNKRSGIEVFPGNTSSPPDLMYTPGVTDYHDRYIFSQHFRASENARPGTTTVRIIVRQRGTGEIRLTLTIAVLRKGLLPSYGPGIRPPIDMATGSGGQFCVWRNKLFGEPPECFHFTLAKCDHPRYTNPRNGYELVGANMTWQEGDVLIARLSQYGQDAYGCRKKSGIDDDGHGDENGDRRDEKDTDGDGTPDHRDGCAVDPNKTFAGKCGCGTPDIDQDRDGTMDCNDGCPENANKTDPGICGCNESDTDSDGDGTMDCKDGCPDDANKTDPGDCGCGESDTDSDGDGTMDCNDYCPDDPSKIEPGICDCGTSDTDSDGDGTMDCEDGCPNDPNKTDPGLNGCGQPETTTSYDPRADANVACTGDSDCQPGYKCISKICTYDPTKAPDTKDKVTQYQGERPGKPPDKGDQDSGTIGGGTPEKQPDKYTDRTIGGKTTTTTAQLSSGTSTVNGDQQGATDYVVVCNKGDYRVVISKNLDPNHHVQFSNQVFKSQDEAIKWVSSNCSSWHCDTASGACDPNPDPGKGGTGTYAPGDITGYGGGAWQKVNCSLGGPDICWGSGGRTLGDADGDGRADILLNGSLHWKNVGGSAQPALTPPPTSK